MEPIRIQLMTGSWGPGSQSIAQLRAHFLSIRIKMYFLHNKDKVLAKGPYLKNTKGIE